MFDESTVEDSALSWLEATGWTIAHGPHITPDQTTAERQDYGEVVLAQRLRDPLARLYTAPPAEAGEDGEDSTGRSV